MTDKKRQRVDPIQARIADIGGKIYVSEEKDDLFDRITDLLGATASKLAKIVQSGEAGTYDTGRLARSLEFLGQAKYAAYEAISLPDYEDGQEKRPSPPDITICRIAPSNGLRAPASKY